MSERLKVRRRGDAGGRLVVVFASHGRRLTNTYPATPNTTGIIINIPHTVLIIVFSVPLLDHVVVVALHPAARAGMAGVGSPDN